MIKDIAVERAKELLKQFAKYHKAKLIEVKPPTNLYQFWLAVIEITPNKHSDRRATNNYPIE